MSYSQNSEDATEIVMGIIGPIGCNRELVIETTKKLARHYTYKVEVIKVSDIIRSYVKVDITDEDQYDRVTKLMDAGNKLRNDTNDNPVLAKMAAVEIAKKRKNHTSHRVIYIIDSLKHPEEVTTLRDIYGYGFYLFAVHSPESTRDTFLKKFCHIKTKSKRQKLIDRDKDENIGYGQSTSAAFHLADFFITENGDNKKVWNSLERYFDLIFGDPFRTPTFQEYAMFMAHAASIRSADLSRQVGAVITRDTDIISTGSNECPKAFGGTYWPQFNVNTKEIYDTKDGRDYTRGVDHNAQEKEKIIAELRKNIPENLIEILDQNIKNSDLKDITEYGRVVHAEMDAILGSARRGESTKGSDMYCTTYPCHNCAKHIVTCGIKRVIYIEPYPKSKALHMHGDSISTDSGQSHSKVIFRPFIGVGPRQYINLFSMQLSVGQKIRRKKKSSCEKIDWVRAEAHPRIKMFNKSYIEVERILDSEISSEFTLLGP